MKMAAFKLLVIFFFGQVSSLLAKANHLVVSGTNHTQVNVEERAFDGVYEVVKDPTEFFGAEFKKTVYKKLNDPDNDVHSSSRNRRRQAFKLSVSLPSSHKGPEKA